VDRVYTAFEGAAVKFPSAKTVVSGNPVRRGIVDVGRRTPAPAEKFRLLIFGGSQGAQTINAAFLDATEYLTDIWGSLSVVHQSGEDGFGAAEEAYARKGLKVELESFIEDMAGAYAVADLVVCRAGATSIAEITALGLASILVPYPFSTDGHQVENARYLAASGAAMMIMPEDLTGSTLAGAIRKFYDDRVELKRVGSAAGALGRPDAARTIVGDFTGLLQTRGAKGV
jgi:UDP-N-acetylglucosamine--N-acetylmuramyl-(pentapeptide) pyrophosphoryl-undecaprenol N-acetylglucosamine transferase